MEMEKIKHVGVSADRRIVWNPKEKIYAEVWEKVNENPQGPEFSFLAHILNTEERMDSISNITQRDATVAASVIQWLGSNIGQLFLRDCKKEVEKNIGSYRLAQKVIERMKGTDVISSNNRSRFSTDILA